MQEMTLNPLDPTAMFALHLVFVVQVNTRRRLVHTYNIRRRRETPADDPAGLLTNTECKGSRVASL